MSVSAIACPQNYITPLITLMFSGLLTPALAPFYPIGKPLDIAKIPFVVPPPARLGDLAIATAAVIAPRPKARRRCGVRDGL